MLRPLTAFTVLALMTSSCQADAQVTGVLPDRTPYTVSGIPDPQGPPQLNATLMIDLDGGTRTLGRSTVLNEASARLAPYWNGTSNVVVPAGNWTLQVVIDPDVQAELGVRRRDEVTRAISGHTVDGWPVFDLEPPLRFPRADEITQGVSHAYENFTVASGCDPDIPQDRQVCDESGTLSVFAPELRSLRVILDR